MLHVKILVEFAIPQFLVLLKVVFLSLLQCAAHHSFFIVMCVMCCAIIIISSFLQTHRHLTCLSPLTPLPQICPRTMMSLVTFRGL